MTYLAERSILVTGGTGSFGRAFVRYALEHLNPKRLVIFSRMNLSNTSSGLSLVMILDSGGSSGIFVIPIV